MLFDYHTHTRWSFDGSDSAEALCEAAVAAGAAEIAVTDHLDMDGHIEGIYPYFDIDGAGGEIRRAQEKYASRLGVLRGIELGQPYLYPDEARAVLNRQNFDYVIGSVHALGGVPDFAFMRYAEMTVELRRQLFSRYLDAHIELCAFGGIDTVGHIGYPLRYMRREGVGVELDRFEDKLRLVLRRVIDTGLCLEVNTKGLRGGEGCTTPDDYILSLYRDEGGRALTLGSDAHRAADVCAGVAETAAHLLSLGFDTLTVFGSARRELPLQYINGTSE